MVPISLMTELYLRYGLSNKLSEKLTALNLPKTTLEKTSKKNLKQKYGLTDDEISFVKDAIKREPIDAEVVQELLENSNFTCCICKGTKAKSYLIHHILKYSISRDNSYHNLAVLCPEDHDLAHRTGDSLTLKLTERQIINAKRKWEKEVKRRNIQKAVIRGNVFEIDFLNIPRILEVCLEVFGTIPTTIYTNELVSKDLIDGSGSIKREKIVEVAKNPSTPLIFFGPYGSATLRFHYYEIFKCLLQKLEFRDLDTFLNKQSIKSGVIGEYCYYIGGLYSDTLPDPITADSKFMRFYFKRSVFCVEWLVDPKYFVSSSAKWRTFHRSIYIIYGRIRGVDIREAEGKKLIFIDIRPYCFGLPEDRIDRTPNIAYRDMIDDAFEQEG